MRLFGFVKGSGIFVFLMGLPVFGGPVQGIQNFWQIDDHVYRGAQPTDEGFRNLAKLGIRTVIDLREADARSTAEEKTVTSAGMRYVSVPMTGLTPPTSEQITKILTMLQDGSVGPVFVHCKRGADRTGLVIAVYRIQHDQWENSRALAEAMSRGMSWLQFPRQNYVLQYRPEQAQAQPFEAKARDTQHMTEDTNPQPAMRVLPEPVLTR
jgi:tyrosine-protein phosphatase SIW14